MKFSVQDYPALEQCLASIFSQGYSQGYVDAINNVTTTADGKVTVTDSRVLPPHAPTEAPATAEPPPRHRKKARREKFTWEELGIPDGALLQYRYSTLSMAVTHGTRGVLYYSDRIATFIATATTIATATASADASARPHIRAGYFRAAWLYNGKPLSYYFKKQQQCRQKKED